MENVSYINEKHVADVEEKYCNERKRGVGKRASMDVLYTGILEMHTNKRESSNYRLTGAEELGRIKLRCKTIHILSHEGERERFGRRFGKGSIMDKKGKSEGYILGIDQGGTKTAAVVMREDGFIVGSATMKGAYFPYEGMDSALEQMALAAEDALRNSGVGKEEIAYTVAGVGGIDWVGDDIMVSDALRERLSLGEIFACNDAVIAFYSGAMCSHGVVICAGTGMNGALIDKNGRQFVYGDYMEEKVQGGSALAKRALRKVFDAELGLCPPTKLKPLFLGQAEVSDVDALLKRYMTESEFRKELRFLMPQILKVAKLEDAAACALLDEFSGEIVAYIEAGLRKMEMKAEEEEIVLAGSVFKGADNPLTCRVVKGIQERLCGAKVLQARYEPVVGACIMGMTRMGKALSEREKSIRESAAVLGLLRS